MVANITYAKTYRGQRAVLKELPTVARQVLTVMREPATEEVIFAKLNGVQQADFKQAMVWLLEGGFLKLTEVNATPAADAPAIAKETATPKAIEVEEISIDEFTQHATPAAAVKKSPVSTTDAASNAFEATKTAIIPDMQLVDTAQNAAQKERVRLATIRATKKAAAIKQRAAKIKADASKQKKVEEKHAPEKALVTPKLTNTEEAPKAFAAPEKTKAAEKAKPTAQEQEKALKWAKLKVEAKAQAKEKARRKAQANVEAKAKKRRKAESFGIKTKKKQRLASLFTLVKFLLAVAVILPALLILGTHFIDNPVLTSAIEKVVAKRFDTHINIQSTYVRLLPKPHVLLDNTSLVDAPDVRAKTIRVFPNIMNIKEKYYDRLDKPYQIDTLQIEEALLTQEDLSHINTWVNKPLASDTVVVKQLIFNQLFVDINNMTLPTLNATVHLDDANHVFKQATIQTESNNFTLLVNRINDGYLLDIKANNWRIPISPFPVLNSLTASGTITNNRLLFKSISGQLYDGTLTVQSDTDLSSPTFSSTSQFELNGLPIKRIATELNFNPAVHGALSGNGFFSFNIDKANNNLTVDRLNAIFDIEKGMLTTVDLVEAMRTGNVSGQTNFDSLSGQLSYKNKTYQLNNLILKDTLLNAQGKASIDEKQEVTANLSTSISTQNKIIINSLAIAGPATALKRQN